MDQEVIGWLSSDNGLLVHLGIFIMLILGGLGFPIPEDIPIVLAGVAAAKGIVDLPKVFVTCYIGVVLADQLLFALGYYFGQAVLSASTRSPFLPSVTAERVDLIREGLRKRRLVYIFIGRHLFPVRSAVFLTAGALRIPYLEFLLADAAAALISISIVLAIGFFLGETLGPEVLSHLMQDAHYYILAIVVLCLLFYYGKRRFGSRKVNLCSVSKLPKAEEIISAPELLKQNIN